MQTETFTLGPLTMYVSEDHRFGTDAFLLAYYANVKPDSVVCDLCTGCGIIPLIFCKNVKPHLIYAVDIQANLVQHYNTLHYRVQIVFYEDKTVTH